MAPSSAYFKPGSAVEVSIDGGGFCGSWFSGTIVSRVDYDRFMVQYPTFLELLSLHRLRPLPPPESHHKFKYADKVEAFRDHCWRECHVTEDLGNGRFCVYFTDSEEEMVFPTEQLRLHRKWINNNWIPPIPNHKDQGQKRNRKNRERNRRNRDRISKRKKDMISELPDCILLRIMNFMETKDAVKTCVLSKRWKNLCKCLTNLTFCSSRSQREYRQLENFKKFATWILASRDDSCSLLNLSINGLTESELVHRVIKYALSHNVQKLTMDSPFGVNCKSSPFCCHSLTSLELCTMYPSKIILPKSLYLPALKSLHLRHVKFTVDDNDFAEPFSNCHVLNTLILVACSLYNNKQVLCISNPTISSLRITNIKTCFKIVLSTPNLSSFTVAGILEGILSTTCNLSFLEEVYVNLCHWVKSSALITWLQVLATVKILTLSLESFEIILNDLLDPSSMTPQPPCFIRLVSLKLEGKKRFVLISDEKVNRVVEYLLQNSPMDSLDIIRSA